MRWHTRNFLNQSTSLDDELFRQYELPGLEQLLQECDACVLVYSCTDRRSFELLRQVWEELRRGNGFDEDSKATVLEQLWVVHDNLDIDESEWQVSFADGERWSSRISATFRAVSTRTGQGAKDFRQEVARRVLESQS